ncbi:hypothetical protein [Halomonas caseinilytica]|uniref:Uncharacterized protein n=1 Tax=Halomonas caseinilytica TaxID=438744 RepID=A0A1M7BB17_9GAMM|nr:hypothetical protein [Halomonas caseinilytica]SHL52066.1 hypothetical protein SAMN05192556_1208 [Halomonas caseinilytica]
MLTQEFTTGPFTIRPSGRIQGEQLFDIYYGSSLMVERVPATPGTQSQVIEQLGDALSKIVVELCEDHEASHRIDLVNSDGERLAAFRAGSSVVGGMTAGLVDDRFDYWLRSEDGLYSAPVTLSEYAQIRAREELPRNAWIADLLPDEVLTHDDSEWRSPTAWEIRHIVGAGSFIGISGAKAATLVGVNASSFRKYTASENSKNRQNMSFAMWHLLLHRLGVQRLPEGLS